MKRIDSHHHFWKFKPDNLPWIKKDMYALRKDYLPSDLKKLYNQYHIDGSVVVQAYQQEEETKFLLDIAAKNDFVKGVVGWVDLQSEELVENLQLLKKHEKLKGFRHLLQDEENPAYILRPAFQKGLNTIFDQGYTYDLLIFPDQMKGALQTIENMPNGRFVIDHLAKPYIKKKRINNWKSFMMEMGKHPNVYCKLSGLVTEADWEKWEMEDFVPYLDVAMEAFGENRLMFGSDWPVSLLAANFSQVINVIDYYLHNYSIEVKEKIWGKNAIDFYKLAVN